MAGALIFVKIWPWFGNLQLRHRIDDTKFNGLSRRHEIITLHRVEEIVVIFALGIVRHVNLRQVFLHTLDIFCLKEKIVRKCGSISLNFKKYTEN